MSTSVVQVNRAVCAVSEIRTWSQLTPRAFSQSR
ncbi:Uncharacterised protein [Mycobacterium tuberculosis]|nr:Uncharacterised protein [Mycobacterium tuberculosis]